MHWPVLGGNWDQSLAPNTTNININNKQKLTLAYHFSIRVSKVRVKARV